MAADWLAAGSGRRNAARGGITGSLLIAPPNTPAVRVGPGRRDDAGEDRVQVLQFGQRHPQPFDDRGWNSLGLRPKGAPIPGEVHREHALVALHPSPRDV